MIDEDNEDSMFIDPEILQKELVISLPILSESDIEMMLNGVDSSSEESTSSSSLSSFDEEKDKPCLKRDQRRINLLNNPNYGIILSFMGKFRSYINLKKYPLRIFEDNLLNEHEKISGRFMDFHLSLLRKISSGKITQRNQFVSGLTKFAYRFNHDDGEHLEEYGYSKARIDTKLRILKNLLEQQFDRNQTLKTAVADKPSFDIRAKPFGRDRFGASYWLFVDTDCFIRLFRENIDANRTWINLAKNPQELENIIKVLITDSVVRKKFPDWQFSSKSFDDLSPSNKFEEDYALDFLGMREKNDRSLESSPLSVLFGSNVIKTERIHLDPIVNLDRDLTSSPPLSSFLVNGIPIKNLSNRTSDQESINSEEIKANRLSTSSSSNDTRDEIYSRNSSPKLNKKTTNEKTNSEVIILKPSLEQGVKRKLVDYDDTGSDNTTESEKLSPTPTPPPAVVNKESKTNADLPIALRRPRRGGRSRIADLSPDSSSTSKSLSDSSIKKKNVNGKWKKSDQSYKVNLRRQSRRRGKKSRSDFSSTSDDPQPSEEDDLSEDYFPNNTELDKLLTGDFLEEEEDDDDDYVPDRTAKTVAQFHELFQIQSKPCSICLQANHPEFLLLCEDCNDAYHLECVKPELFSIPNDEWYCPLCEHKRLCDDLIEKLIQLEKDEKEFEMKRRLIVSKRQKRLTNATVNLERYVRQPTKRILSSDEDKESEKKTNSTITNDDDDEDSVYGTKKNDENRKPSDEDEDEKGKRRVRSCRQKAQNYSLDDYDKKLKKAMIDAGVNKELIENDSDDSDEMILKRRPSKKRARYELDDDFDASDGKNADGDFAPSRHRPTNDDSRTMNDDSQTMNDDSRSDHNDFDMSEDDSAWRNRRQSSASSISKNKSKPKPTRNIQRKPPIVSDEDTIPYDPDLSNASSAINVKSEPTIAEVNKNQFPTDIFSKTEIVKNVYDPNKIVEKVVYTNEAANLNKPRRPKRAAVTKKKPSIQDEILSDEEEKSRPPPSRRLPSKKRRGSNDSSLEDDDDYEKLAHKRRLFHHGKAITRKSITSHIKKLVGDEDDDEEEEEEEEAEKEEAEGENGEEPTKDETKKDKNNNSQKTNNNSQYDELRLSDDDDFPDEQEILKTTGLDLKKPVNGKKAAPVRIPFMPSIQSYQFAMVDPTAQFEFTCPPEASSTEPSDVNQANGDNSLATMT